MRWLVVVLIGCGRIAFDPRADAAERQTCPTSTTVPDPIVITGRTFFYMDWDNDPVGVLANVDVTAYQPITNLVIGSTTSDAAGSYSLALTGGGAPVAAMIQYSATGYFSTHMNNVRPFDRDTTSTFLPLWGIGDGPMWTTTMMTTVYSSVNATLDTSLGTVNIAVRDCNDQPLEDVEVTVAPPPRILSYQAADGRPDAQATRTIGPFAHVLALGQAPVTIRISARSVGPKSEGFTFEDITVRVAAGNNNILAVIRGAQ